MKHKILKLPEPKIKFFSKDGRFFELTEDYEFETSHHGIITIKKGFVTDFMSIPFPFNMMPTLSRTGKGRDSAGPHDKFCADAANHIYTVENHVIAAEYFHSGLKLRKVNPATRRAMFWAVKYLGPKWNSDIVVEES